MTNATKVAQFGHYASDKVSDESRKRQAFGTDTAFLPENNHVPACLYLQGNTLEDSEVTDAGTNMEFMNAFMRHFNV